MNNFKKVWLINTKIKGPIAAYLLSHEVLTEWAGLSLRSRVKELEAQVGLKVNVKTLAKFYKRNKVSNVVVKYQYQ